MAGEDDDVIVSVAFDDDGVRPAAAEGDGKTKVVDPADPAIADLKSQFAAMTGRLATAEATARTATQHAQEATQRVQHMEGEVVTSQLDTVLSGISAAETEANSAEAALAIAIEAGDAAAQARANRQIATATSRLQRLTEAKEELEDAVKTKRATPPQNRQQAASPPPTDPVEGFVRGMSAQSAAWIRAHPDCVTDPKKNARMLAAHNLALADDVAVDTPEYFQRIEEGIGAVKVEKKPDPKPGADGRRPSSGAAPAAGAGGALSGGEIDVRLTKREALSATDGTLVWNYEDPTGQKRWVKGDPIGLKEMARRKHEGMRNGLYDKTQYEA